MGDTPRLPRRAFAPSFPSRLGRSWSLVAAYKYGDPNRILQPTDFSGNKCGVDTAVAGKPYLLFFDPSLCVRPTANVLINGCSSPSVSAGADWSAAGPRAPNASR